MISVGTWRANQPHLERLETDLLLCQVLDCSRAHILTHPERCLSSEQIRRLDTWAQRVQRGEPLAYLIGKKEFWGLELEVSPAVLVPRPETELLVEWAIELAAQLPPSPRILDLGTGSGAIAIALATTLKTPVVASDSSNDALAVARRNSTQCDAQVNFVQGDWFRALPDQTARFHLIVANPPYIAEQDPHLPSLASEPPGALTAGVDGLRDLLHIIDKAPEYLREMGWIALEHGHDQGAAVRQAMVSRGFSRVETRTDLANLERVTAGNWEQSP